ncbi:hypothetical protein BC628DRAFT_1344210 [Trametes gibbosa]|nr:hypothetical protein BC628DRAFT_1344210 [Trametes gibbosa]
MFPHLEMKGVLRQPFTKVTLASSNKPMVWNLRKIHFPTIGEGTEPTLPLMTGLYHGDEVDACIGLTVTFVVYITPFALRNLEVCRTMHASHTVALCSTSSG